MGTRSHDMPLARRPIATSASRLGGEKFRILSLGAADKVSVGDVIELKYGKSLPATRRIAGEVPVVAPAGWDADG